MDDDLLLLVLIVAAVVLLNRRAPVPSVSTSSTVLLPDGSTAALDSLQTINTDAYRDVLNRIVWQ